VKGSKLFRCECSSLHLVEVSLSPKMILSSSVDTVLEQKTEFEVGTRS
jgi:hypothetical protein